MTKEELTTKLYEINEHNRHDSELAHIIADKLLLQYINDETVSEAYELITKWYA